MLQEEAANHPSAHTLEEEKLLEREELQGGVWEGAGARGHTSTPQPA